MKNIILTMVVTMLTASSGLFGQGIGLKAGLNLSKWKGDDTGGTDPKATYHMGVSYQFPIGQKTFLEPAILYSKKGTLQKRTETIDFSGISEMTFKSRFDFSVNYLEIPITLKYQFDPKLYFLGSTAFSVLLNNEFTYAVTQCVNGDCESMQGAEELDNLSNFDASLSIGLGGHLTEKINLEVRYQLGLLTIDDSGDSDVFNRTIMFSLGYSF